MIVQNLGPRSYIPAGSRPGRVYTLGNLDVTKASSPGSDGKSFLGAVAFSVAVSVLSHFIIRRFFK